ncbi:hypothetical protein EV127DRAFT_252231 [Xylaria flabelliformis]|nr:hypothetical protein EV127DRAFT_252231 [Xylaria flabelliformis]
MAGRTRMQVGSGPWIAEERLSATQIAQSEVEEFTFSVQNDFDWLNEHMAEVFSENQINVAEIFKTPGKLRGKTPRTVRKGNLENRAPLSNIFSATPKNAPNPFIIANHGRPNTPRVKVAVDPQPSPPRVVIPPSPPKQILPPQPVPPAKPVSMVDSGYHGSQSHDAAELDDFVISDEATEPFSPQRNVQSDHVMPEVSPTDIGPRSPLYQSHPTPEAGSGDLSAQYFTAHVGAASSPFKQAHHDTTTPMGSPALPPFSNTAKSPTPAQISDGAHTPTVKPQSVESDVLETALDEVPRSPSDGSSPIRPIVRKSSLNFASLPAREPITHKSIGNRISRTSHLDQNRTSYYRHTGGKSLGHAKQDTTDDEHDDMDIDEFPASPKPKAQTEIDNAATHNKTYTQRLQDQINKLGKGTLANSAATNVEDKPSPLSPSTSQLGLHQGLSTETLKSPSAKESQPLYPDLSRQVAETQTLASTTGPERAEGTRTRASIEKEKSEEKRKKEEAEEARQLAEQTEKLEKAREKEREKARVFNEEQERVAAIEKQAMAQKEKEKRAAMATPAKASKLIRGSPQKVKPRTAPDQDTDAIRVEEDTVEVEMFDATSMMPPPSVPRSAAPPSAMKAREIKRPIKPTKESTSKAKQAPTVIRVNMGSQHSQFHSSNSSLSSSLHDTLSLSQPKNKAGQPSVQPKPSLQSLKSSTSSAGRPKALEAAARRKEQEEREAQRRRDAKAELERKRVAVQEEERRQEQQRKLEAERQKDEERKQAAAQAEAKKNAQRQAMIEKAKQTRAPPPPVRGQPGGLPDYSRNEAGPSRPPSRMGSMAPRSQDDTSRPVNAVLSNASKAQTKRPLPQEAKESKRMRMTDELNDPAENEKQPSLKGAPVRPSGGVKKDLPTKSMFSAGYTNAPSQSVTRDLFKATVTSQHNTHIKTAHPLDMAQVSKSAIPFAPNSHAVGGPSKTPARPIGMAATKSAVKSVTRSSPRFQNGDSIELPEINTDDEDDDENDDGGGLVADWADSPNLRKALVEQENKNPFEVFGAPAPLNMEEVFARNKDRFPKFRARTSSANWSGPDGLTEEDIRKDLAAREKMRREGGWSYDMGREMV